MRAPAVVRQGERLVRQAQPPRLRMFDEFGPVAEGHGRYGVQPLGERGSRRDRQLVGKGGDVRSVQRGIVPRMTDGRSPQDQGG
nr:hypothetical protein [Streptomyces capitiformicae]